MKTISRVLLLAAIGCLVYGYWGAFTGPGNEVYDEMSGMVPFFILVIGIILFIVAVVLMIILRRRKKTAE